MFIIPYNVSCFIYIPTGILAVRVNEIGIVRFIFNTTIPTHILLFWHDLFNNNLILGIVASCE